MGRYRLNTTHLSWVGLVNPPNIYIYIYIYIYINKKKTKIQKIPKILSIFFLIFSCIFIPILININLYFYTINIQIRYENTPFSLKCCKKLYRKKWIFFCLAKSLKNIKIFISCFHTKQKLKKYVLACIWILITSLLKLWELG